MTDYTITLSTGETCHAHADDAITARAIVAADLRSLGRRDVRIDAIVRTYSDRELYRSGEGWTKEERS